MKKLITLILVLVGYVGSVSADWYVRGTFNSWVVSDEWKMSISDNDSYTLVKTNFVVASETNYEFKVDDGSWGESYPGSNYYVTIPAGTYDLFFYFNATSHDVKLIYNIELRSSTALLGTFERTGLGTYSLTLDLSNSLGDQYFKPVAYYATPATADWMGVGSFNGGANLTDNDDLLDTTTDVGAEKGYYYILKNSNKSFKEYTFNITYGSNGWSMSVAGKTARNHTDYTFNFINNKGWSNIYCYTYDDNDVAQVDWPGTEMTTTDGTSAISGVDYDKYTKTFTFYEPYPTKVIFNNGSGGLGNQTRDLTLANNGTYSYSLYYVIGRSANLGNWNAASVSVPMTDDGDGTYSFSLDDEILGSDFDYKVIEIPYYGSSEVYQWWPTTANQTLSTPVAGKYDLAFYFDPSKTADNSTECVAGSSATKTYEAVTIGATGWATTVTNSALDFSALTENFTAYTATIDNSTVALTEVSDVQAETGLVLKGTQGTYYAPLAASSSTAKGDLLYSSTSTYNTWGGHSFYGLTVRDGKGVFAKISGGDGVALPAGKAFLKIEDGGTGAHELSVVFDGGTNGINTIETTKSNNNVVFNLAGQRVAAPVKGLYIVNGKKVMVK